MEKHGFPISRHFGIYDRYTYVLKTLKMGRALVAVKKVTGAGYDPLSGNEEGDPPYITFSRINFKKEEAILEYANRYGVPFNPNRIYPYIKTPLDLDAIPSKFLKPVINRPSQAASRAATSYAAWGTQTTNFGVMREQHEIQIKEPVYEQFGIDLYRKNATGGARTLVYPLDDFWYEVDQMCRVLEWKGVVEGSLPASERAPGGGISAEYLSTALNQGIGGVKVSTFVGYKSEDSPGKEPKILKMFVPIDFKQALYAAILEDVDSAPVGRCAHKRCHRFYVIDRRGKVYCSKKCQHKAARMRGYTPVGTKKTGRKKGES